MHVLWTGVLCLLVALPLLADEKPKADPPPKEKSPLAEKVAEEIKAASKELAEWQKEAAAAKTDAEKLAALNKRKKIVQMAAGKILKHAQKMPKDPAAVEALTMVAMIDPSTTDGKEALDLLVKDHADKDQLGQLCLQLAQRPDSEKAIRSVYEQTKNQTVKLQAALSLAKALTQNEPTDEQKKEAEKLLAEVKDKGKEAKLPEQFIKSAEGALFEIRHLAVGMKAPDTESANLEDKSVKLSDHQGKVVVLDFWATWCGPCKAMIPHERELVKKYKDKPFVFVSVSADEEKDTLKKFLENEEMPWVHWWSGTKGIVREWKIEAFPTMYIVDAKGVIRGKIVGGGDENEKKLDELVAKLVKEASTKPE